MVVSSFSLSWIVLLVHVRMHSDASRVNVLENLSDFDTRVEEDGADVSGKTGIACDDSVKKSVARNSYLRQSVMHSKRTCKCPVGTHIAKIPLHFVNRNLQSIGAVPSSISVETSSATDTASPLDSVNSDLCEDIKWRRFDPEAMMGKNCQCESNAFPIYPQFTKAWMRGVDSRMHLKDLTIPGTHDTMAYAFERTWMKGRRPTKDITGMTLTHEYDLKQQLEAGVRWLDLRIGLSGGSVVTCHGPFQMECDLSCVLDTISGFLDEHNTEAVFFMLKPECSPESDWKQLSDKTVELMNENTHVLRQSETLSGSTMLGDIRGKMVIVHTEGWDKLPFFKEAALDTDPPLSLLVLEGEKEALQNEFKLSPLKSKEKRVYGKAEKVLDFLRLSAHDAIDSIRVNYFSASGVLDEVRETAMNVNDWLYNNLQTLHKGDADNGYAFGACLLDGLPTAGHVIKLIVNLIHRNEVTYKSHYASLPTEE